MLLDEVRRRNRRRALLLGAVAAVNYWVVVSFFLFLGAYLYLPHVIPPLLLALVAGAVGVAAYLWGMAWSAARATVRSLGARPLADGEWPKTGHLVEELAIATGTPPVHVAYLEDEVPNALTVGAGPKRSAIVITTGLVATLTRDELEAVLAVQLCEIARLDVALRTIVVTCGRGASAIFDWFEGGWRQVTNWPWLILTWPSMALGDVVQKLAFRNADFGADEMAVSITRNPDALRSALAKLLAEQGTVGKVTRENAALWFEPVPDTGGRQPRHVLLGRYSMTPSLEDRIARLGASS